MKERGGEKQVVLRGVEQTEAGEVVTVSETWDINIETVVVLIEISKVVSNRGIVVDGNEDISAIIAVQEEGMSVGPITG